MTGIDWESDIARKFLAQLSPERKVDARDDWLDAHYEVCEECGLLLEDCDAVLNESVGSAADTSKGNRS